MYKSNIALTIMLLVWTLQYLHHSAHSLVLTTKSQSVLSPQMSPTIIETWISTLNMETNHWNKPICTILSLSKYWGFAQLVTGVEDSCSEAICTVLERGIVLTVGDTVWDVAGWGETKAWWNKSVYCTDISAFRYLPRSLICSVHRSPWQLQQGLVIRSLTCRECEQNGNGSKMEQSYSCTLRLIPTLPFYDFQSVLVSMKETCTGSIWFVNLLKSIFVMNLIY